MLTTSETSNNCPPIIELDGRTRSARRIRALVALFTASLGSNLSVMQQDGVQRAAELQAFAEALRSRSLKGESIAPGDIIKAENLADRARRSLRLSEAPTRTVRPIRERLAGRA